MEIAVPSIKKIGNSG